MIICLVLSGGMVIMLPRTQTSLCDLSLSLEENLRAKEGGKEKTGETSPPRIFLLPMVPCSSLPVTRVSRSPLCKKGSARSGGW